MSDKGNNIYLIGFMGAGKSTIAKMLQERLGMQLVEMDERIVREQQMPITEIFDTYGEEHFRDIESALVCTIAKEGNSIISCGGGVVIRSQNVEEMKKSGTIVFLTATPQTIFERVRYSKERPILNGNMNVEYIEQLMDKRRTLYEAAAEITVETDGKTIEEICDEIIRIINGGKNHAI